MSNFPYIYKLSLATGQSLDLKKNCEIFIQELSSAKNLNFASVWIKSQYLDGEAQSKQAKLVCALPADKKASEIQQVDSVHFENYEETPFLVMDVKDVYFNDLFPKQGTENCSSIVFKLGETGFLQMLMPKEKSGLFGKKSEFFKKEELNDFLQIIQKFTVSVQNCITFNSLGDHGENTGIKSINLFSNTKTVATMNHEIRNPMDIILGYSDLLSDTSLSEKQAEYLEVITSSSKHLFNVLNEVLDYSKILARQFALKEMSFDVNDLIINLINSNKPKAEKSGLTLSYSVDKWIIKPLIGDKNKLLHALQYLVDNALKFTIEGNVKLDCKLLEADTEKYKLVFSIEDNGIGIDSKNLKKIFKSFTQEDDSINRKFGGLGLGLSISRHIIQLLGGELEVESTKGQGSRFFFTIELKVDNNTTLKNDQKNLKLDKNKTRKIKVLLVDDDPYQRNLGGECLADWDLKTAFNGEDAIEQLNKNENFDIILMDIRMPVMDGIEATRIIRNSLNLKMPIIAVSGEVLEGTIQECSEAGMNTFVSKPYKREELINRMVTNLGRADLYNPEEESLKPESLKGRKALVVEDNMMNQMVTKNQLKKLNCEVDVIGDGNLVLDQCRTKEYDFVLMDLYMNEMGGFDATKELRKNGFNIPVIAFSGDDSPETVESCLEAGMNGLILKPSSSPELASKINSIIDNFLNPVVYQDKLYDLSFMQGIFVNNPTKMVATIKDFINQTPNVLDQINLLMAVKDYDQVWRKVHFLKSSALSLGIAALKKDLEKVIAVLKKMGKNEHVTKAEKEEILQQIIIIETTLREAVNQLKKEFD